jgi:hypothetical protein
MVKIPRAEPGYTRLNSGVKGRDKSRYENRTKNKYAKKQVQKNGNT